jgi:hypothetical protein
MEPDRARILDLGNLVTQKNAARKSRLRLYWAFGYSCLALMGGVGAYILIRATLWPQPGGSPTISGVVTIATAAVGSLVVTWYWPRSLPQTPTRLEVDDHAIRGYLASGDCVVLVQWKNPQQKIELIDFTPIQESRQRAGKLWRFALWIDRKMEIPLTEAAFSLLLAQADAHSYTIQHGSMFNCPVLSLQPSA